MNPFENMGEEDSVDAKQLIADLRGGIPVKCDFCGENRAPELMHPEEAGMWICKPCIDKGV